MFKRLFNREKGDNIKESSKISGLKVDSKSSFSAQVERNLNGQQKEKKHEVEFAIKEYEKNIAEGFEGNYPYERLAIIYRKNNDYDNEIRVLERAIEVFSELYKSSHRQDIQPKLDKFMERLAKSKKLKNMVK